MTTQDCTVTYDSNTRGWVVSIGDRQVRRYDTDTHANAYQRGYREAVGLDPDTGKPANDPVIDDQAQYERDVVTMTNILVEDLMDGNPALKHHFRVMTAQCQNCHAMHGGHFARVYVERGHEAFRFSTNTRENDYETEDNDYGDTDFTTGFECVQCGAAVDTDVLTSIIYLRDETMYEVHKSSYMRQMLDEKRRLEVEAEGNRVFVESSGIAFPQDLRFGMPCRYWSMKRVRWVIGTVADWTESSRTIKAVDDHGNVSMLHLSDVTFGAAIERIGDFVLHHKVTGGWTWYRETNGEETTNGIEWKSREETLVAMSSVL